jgi:hypothetical protein
MKPKPADITKILDAITDKVLAHGPAQKNADKRPRPPPKPKTVGPRKSKAKR